MRNLQTLQRCLLLAAAVACPGLAHAATTNWVAFFDYGARGAGTAPTNVLSWAANNNNVGGYLTNQFTGEQLPVFLWMTSVGSPANASGLDALVAGTPAYNIFNGFCDLASGGCAAYMSAAGMTNWITLSNLNASMTYIVIGTVNRNNSAYTVRQNLVELLGAETFTPAHTAGAAVIARPAPNQVVLAGYNASGDYASWADIDPGADGVIEFRNSRYNFQTAYALSALQVIEVNPGPCTNHIVITNNTPATLQLLEQRAFILSVGASGCIDAYQWYQDGNPIPGATTSSHQVTNAIAGPGGSSGQYWVVLTGPNEPGGVQSVHTAVTVLVDTFPPTVVAVHGSHLLNRVHVSFSEPLDLTTAQDAANYAVSGGADTVGVTSATLDSTGTNIVLVLDASLTLGNSYELTVSGVQDRAPAPNAIGETVVPFRAFVLSRGFALEQLYLNIGTGTTVADLTGHPNYPNSPDRVNYKPTLEGPNNAYDQYGTRLSGWIMPPASGEYAFYFCSDDQGQLSLSADNSPANLALVAREISNSGARNWTGPGANGDRGNPPSNVYTNTLAAGQMYAFEALAKENSGSDNTGVAWRMPGQPEPAIGSSGIPGAFLYSLADPMGASVTITQQPAHFVAVYRGAAAPQTVFQDDFAENSGVYAVTNYGSPSAPWTYNEIRYTWSCHGSNTCNGPNASGLNVPAIHLTNGGGVVLTFDHRYSFEGFRPGDGTPWDGGQIRVSVNGGSFATVPAANFTTNGYVYHLEGSVIAALTNTPGWAYAAFVGESPDYVNGTYITSKAALGTFNPGDVIQIQFLASWDDCSEGPEPNWEIRGLQVTAGATVLPTATFWVGAQSTYLSQPNANIVYVWQRDDGAGFQDIPGAYGPTNTLSAGLADYGALFRCLVYSPAASATSSVARLTVVLPLTVSQEADQVTISWPLPGTHSRLDEAPALGANPAWAEVPPSSYRTNATSIYVTVPATGNRFFQLRRAQE
ncbi:MAG: Ig-like domain-containing protein [Verrucomicrobia bacterium]|nr:Ig-like domain-containing protein [Verrucomicrobiota bacterium]